MSSKMTSLQPYRTIILASTMIFFMIFSINLASADGLMPYHSWNPDTKTATIKDYFGLETIADIQLIRNTDFCLVHCEAVIKITPNKDITAEGSDYNVLFKDILTKSKDMSAKVKKLDYYKLVGNESYYETVPDYSSQCITLANSSQQCNEIQSGSHQEQRWREVWQKTELTPSFFRKIDGNVILKIAGEKDMFSSVDWIPKFYGVEMPEMAAWQSSYNVGLQGYWTMNESNTTDAVNSVNFQRNFTATGAVSSAGKIGTSWNITANDGIQGGIGSGMAGANNSKDMSITAWIYRTGAVTYPTIIGKTIDGAMNSPEWAFEAGRNTCANCIAADFAGGGTKIGGTIPQGTWVFVAMSISSGAGTFYINGTANGTFSGVSWHDSAGKLEVGYIPGLNLFVGSIDEVAIWNRSLSGTEIADMYNSGAGMTYKTDFSGTISTTLDSPANLLNTSASTLNFNATITPVTANVTNATLYLWNRDGTLKSTTTNLYATPINYTFSANFTGISITPDAINYTWNIKACGLETGAMTYICSFQVTNRTFTQDDTAPNLTIVFPTIADRYMPPANISLNFTVKDAGVNSGSCSYSLNSESIVYLSKCENTSIVINNAGNNNITLYANDSLGNSNVSSVIFYAFSNLSFCSGDIAMLSINFTFKDESTNSAMNATLDASTWIYHSGNDTAKTVTYRFSNSSHNTEYDFCIYPNWTSIFSDINFQFAHSGDVVYPQRQWQQNSFSLNNVTSLQTLYLLSSSSGQYVTFQIINPALQPLSDVTVSAARTINGLPVTIETKLTDSSGAVIMWLNPLYAHSIVASKTGYVTSTSTITPSQTSYTITLAQTGTANVTDTTNGVAYSILPAESYLNPLQTYNFNFTISSSSLTLSKYWFNLTTANGTVLASNLSTTAGTISTMLNTGNNASLIMNIYYNVSGQIVSTSKYWLITNLSGSEWSIKNFFTDLDTYTDSGIFGLDSFGITLIIFLIILAVTGITAYNFGLYSPAAIAGIMTALVMFFDAGLGLIQYPFGISLPIATIIFGLIFIALLFKEASSY